MLTAIVREARARSILDVGCGCGSYSRTLLPQGARITAFDPSKDLISRWTGNGAAANLAFLCMDAGRIGFRDASFDLVLERASLHHIAAWEAAVLEMLRVSRGPIALEEPVDDLRSPEKQNTAQARALFLELQREVHYPHFAHLLPEQLLTLLRRHATVLSHEIQAHDEPVGFTEYFAAYPRFALRSAREGYWLDRLDRLRSELGEESLCEDDILTIHAQKRVGTER
jgi:SAM-dependent methyltransferase